MVVVPGNNTIDTVATRIYYEYICINMTITVSVNFISVIKQYASVIICRHETK